METNTTEQPIVTLSVNVMPKTYIKFFFHWMRRYRKSYFVLMALYALLLALTVILWRIIDGADMYFPLFLIMLLVQSYLPRHFHDNHREIYRSQTTYAFYEAHFYTSCDARGTKHYKATPYANCQAAETKSAFYLSMHARRFERFYWGDYFDPDPYNASAILDKQYLTEEQQRALRELFKRKFGPNFKQYNQK